MSQNADRLENILVGISLATILIIAVAVGVALHKNNSPAPVQVIPQPPVQQELTPRQEIYIQPAPPAPVQPPQQKQQQKYHYQYKGPFIQIERDIERESSK